jgi:hypothetical protein
MNGGINAPKVGRTLGFTRVCFRLLPCSRAARRDIGAGSVLNGVGTIVVYRRRTPEVAGRR